MSSLSFYPTQARLTTAVETADKVEIERSLIDRSVGSACENKERIEEDQHVISNEYDLILACLELQYPWSSKTTCSRHWCGM